VILHSVRTLSRDRLTDNWTVGQRHTASTKPCGKKTFGSFHPPNLDPRV